MKIFSGTIEDYIKTVGEKNEVDGELVPPLFVQTLLGQQVLDPKWCWKRKAVQHFFIAALLVYVILGTLHIMQQTTDVILKAEGCYTIIITSTFVLKYLLYIDNRVIFRKLYLSAKTTLFELIKEDSEVNSNYVLHKIKMITILLFSIVLFPVIMYLAVCIWNYILGNRITLSKTTSILMPMTSPFYEIGLTLHTMYLFEMAFTFLVIDMWFVILMFFFCATNDALEMVLKIEPRSTEETEQEYANRLKDRLRKFYNGHRELMEYLTTLSGMYKWPSVILLLKVLVAFSLILFLMSKEIKWAFLSNMLPTFIESFAYNWYGEQVKTKAVILNMALLNFDWTGMRLGDRKNYLIIITYMSKEFSIKTAVGNDLSLSTMSAVFKAGYQAFAVLRSMEE